MADITFSTALRTARAQIIIDKLDAGSGPGKFLFYTAPRPAAGGAITTQTLIGACVLSDPSGTAANGVMTFNPINNDVSTDATGTIAWARGVDGDHNYVIDMNTGIEGSGATLIFNTVSAQEGGIVQILSGVLTEGNMQWQ